MLPASRARATPTAPAPIPGRRPLPPISQTRYNAAAILLAPDKWWVTGGNYESGYHRSTEVFVPRVGFSAYVDLPENATYHSLVRVDSTHIMLITGIV